MRGCDFSYQECLTRSRTNFFFAFHLSQSEFVPDQTRFGCLEAQISPSSLDTQTTQVLFVYPKSEARGFNIGRFGQNFRNRISLHCPGLFFLDSGVFWICPFFFLVFILIQNHKLFVIFMVFLNFPFTKMQRRGLEFRQPKSVLKGLLTLPKTNQSPFFENQSVNTPEHGCLLAQPQLLGMGSFLLMRRPGGGHHFPAGAVGDFCQTYPYPHGVH